MTHSLPTARDDIWQQVDAINPEDYARTRNYTDGNVTGLGPYITHGVIDTKTISEHLLSKFPIEKCEKLLFELAWREFFHHTWIFKKNAIFEDLENQQHPITLEIPQNILDASTGIEGVDISIKELTQQGTVHNHARMWIASLVTNFAQASWKTGAKWMYYHLLDGDLASNTLSWQWISGSFSNKRYWFNQENVNKFAKTNQKISFASLPYESFPIEQIPLKLQSTSMPDFPIFLPNTQDVCLSFKKPIYLHHLWNLDPMWWKGQENHFLLIEPSIIKKFPMSPLRMRWLIRLAKDLIPNLKIVVEDFSSFKQKALVPIYFREYPLVSHWEGQCENRSWMFNISKKPYRRFFGFWKAHAKKTFGI